MTRLPVIAGFGGVNAAGRSSFHYGYRRLVIDALPGAAQEETYRSLAALMGAPGEGAVGDAEKRRIREHTLVRRIEPQWFDVDAVPYNRRLNCAPDGTPLTFVTRARNLPETIPAGWSVAELGDGKVRVEIKEATDFLVPSTRSLAVSSAGLLPSGFEPGTLYPSRNHPRGLQLAVYAASDAVQSTGIALRTLYDTVCPDEISVYAGSAMAQMDEQSYGGLLAARFNGGRVTSKQLPLGLAEMPADFVNAYVLGNVGSTGLGMGACATFLYNLRQGVLDIREGRARVAIVGASEAPITPDAIEGYAAMGALGTDDALWQLDAGRGLTAPDHRRACRPFSSNCGFTLAEGAQYAVLMDDELALELGASIYGAVPEVFVNADGFKKSISSPGIGNYLTVAKAVAAARAIAGEESLQRRSFVQAHGTGTPQNRVTESHILDETARLFGIESWPVAAIKAYVGHTVAAAAGDQLMASLGVWEYGIIPGIHSIDHIADDVHCSRLRLQAEHMEVGPEAMDLAILNAKGFGGNNASGVLLSPSMTARLLRGRHGRRALDEHRARNEAVREQAAEYDSAALSGDNRVIYHFGENVLEGEDLSLSTEGIGIPGFGRAVQLAATSPYAAWRDADSED